MLRQSVECFLSVSSGDYTLLLFLYKGAVMKNKFLKSFLFNFLLFGVLLFSVFFPCLTVKAETISQLSGDLPYYVPLGLEVNSYATPEILDYAIYNYENYMSTYEPSVTVNSYLVFTTDGYYSDSVYSFVFITNPTIEESYNDSTNFYENLIRVNSNGTDVHTLVMGANGDFWGMSNNGSFADLLGNSSTISTNVGTFTPRFPFLLVGIDEILSSNDVVIFSNNLLATPDVFQTGHAVEPSFDSDSIIDSGLKPNLVPSAPTYTTYNITNYNAPTIDTSSVENLLKSIWDNITYLGSYIISNFSGFFNNLWNNLSLALGYIGDLLSYLFNKVLNTIKSSVYNLYLNFKDLLEPVLNSFANMINIFNTLYSLGEVDGVFNVGHCAQALFVPDQVELNQFLENHRELAIAGHAQETTGVLLNFIDDVIDSDPIYEVHLPRFYFYDRYMGGYTISFDWYLDIKPTMDTIISGFLIVGYFFWLFVRLPGILHGTAPDSSDASKLMKELDIKG